ncbi:MULTISPECIES: hypothetical protein [Olsenella]|uniref:hypothetical protein n=1 Tax=Olsenella TaxID=133925 RepID=UPI00071C9E8A|nr:MULTISPECIES: hypothetical protein [Olsenella]OFK25276.1 hypothetical protein HMPREF2826_02960 [Olsenella sp. HMSC062G07]
MAPSSPQERQAYVNKVAAEVAGLEREGVVLAGNAFSGACLLKGSLSPEERAGGPLLGGPDGTALRASLTALGYDPANWCAAASCRRDGTPLGPDELRLTLAVLDPDTLIICDDDAAAAVRGAYGAELAGQDDPHQARLDPGWVAHVLGVRVMSLGGFAEALGDDRAKQRMWAYLKQLPPLGEPY